MRSPLGAWWRVSVPRQDQLRPSRRRHRAVMELPRPPRSPARSNSELLPSSPRASGTVEMRDFAAVPYGRGVGSVARELNEVGVVGLGTMGAGITEVLARAGLSVTAGEGSE